MADELDGGQTNNTNLIIGGVVVIVVVLLIGFMIFGMDRNSTVTDQDTTESDQEAMVDETPLAATASTTPAVSPSPVMSHVKEFTVAASNFTFDPAEMRVQQGDTVRVTLTNTSPMPHDWRVDAFAAATKTIMKGQTDMVEFVADKTGMFEYYCSVGNHRQMGMVGKLIVE